MALPTTATTTKPTLKDFGLIQWQTPKTLVKAMPELSNLRIEQAENLNFMVREAFAQFVSVAGSPETAASIVGTASGLFSRFMVPSALAAFCGKTNIPLDLKGRQMVVFGSKQRKA
ncbi:hypothetical protein [Nostoc sp.]